MDKRIVIIEDNPQIRESFAQLVACSGRYHLAGSYGSCEDALVNMKQDLPDIVLMDIGLPGMDGIEGTGRVKLILPSCIVLVITVMEDSDRVFRSLCAGADGYLLKNSEVSDLLLSIDDAVVGGAPMSLKIARMVVQSFKRATDSPLSLREQQVLQGIAQGKSYAKIAVDLFLSKETIKSHIKNIYQKLAVGSKVDALRVAGENNWISR